MVDFLQQQRRVAQRDMADLPLAQAAAEVYEHLLGQVRPVADRNPVDAPMTLSRIRDDADDVIAALELVGDVLRQLSELMKDGFDVVHARREPQIRLIGRVESDGFRVTLDGASPTGVSDDGAYDWSRLDEVADPVARVQLDAERITRAEQAAVYHRQLQRMETEIRQIEADYADRIRRLTRHLLR